jgi:hypothetical protein
MTETNDWRTVPPRRMVLKLTCNFKAERIQGPRVPQACRWEVLRKVTNGWAWNTSIIVSRWFGGGKAETGDGGFNHG